MKRFQDTLDENLKHPNEEIILVAVVAFRSFCLAYYLKQPDEFKKTLLDRYKKALLEDENVAVRRGYSLALGNIPLGMIVDERQVC